MSTSEIAKLESRWRENRQGLSFAPLAEAYRKMGDPSRALEVLGEGLAVNPNYIPASIVLGRCHLDLGDERGAESAFVHVLDLDGENVIALRALADIAERQGRLADARGRLESLLGVDRGNEEARAQMAGLELRIAAGEADAGPPEVVTESAHADVAGAEPDDDDITAESTAVSWEAESTAVSWDDDEPADAAVRLTGPAVEAEPGAASEDESPETPSATENEHGAGVSWGEADPDQGEADSPADVEEPLTEAPVEAADDMDWIPEPEPFVAENIEVDPSIGLQEHLTPAEAVAPLDDLVVDDAPAIADASVEAEQMAGLVGQDFEEHSAGVVPLEDLKTGASTLNDFDDLERASELYLTPADTNEFQVGSAADELGARVQPEAEPLPWTPSEEPPEDFPSLDAEEPVELPRESMPAEFTTVAGAFGSEALDEDAAAEAELDAEPEWDDEALDAGTPELVVTESMADLYLRQGHRKEALAVYRLLYQRSPDDLRLRERVDELETQLAAEMPDAATPAPVVLLAAAEEGSTVVALFRRMLGTPPGEPPHNWQEAVAPPARSLDHTDNGPEPSDGAPTRPAGDHLSLSDVFGDEGSPVPPAMRAAHGAADDEVSFDAFFGDASGDQARSHAPERDDDDLDQFQSWLQNLKR